MNIFGRKKREKSKRSSVVIANNDYFMNACTEGYVPLSRCPEIVAGCRKIAELIGSMTIQIWENREKGDRRIVNELSRKLDIDPNKSQTRKSFIESVAMNLLLYGDGNSVVIPETNGGYLAQLIPVPAGSVTFNPVPGSLTDYTVTINGSAFDSADVLHFVFNPDRHYPWKGQGLKTCLKDLAGVLDQGMKTEKSFMKSEWKPSLIIKVDALDEEFASQQGRHRLLENYIETTNAGEPWVIPSEQIEIEQVRPLSLSDLAISDTLTLNKRTVAAVLGVPAYVLGIGEFKEDEWNNFINTTVKSIAMEIQQELTKKLIISPNWYIKFNLWSLMSWNLETISNILLEGSKSGFVSGNEWREKVGLERAEGLDEFRVLENYIPYDMAGNQKKLDAEGE